MKSLSALLRQLSVGTLLVLGFSLLSGLSVLLAAAVAVNLSAVFQGEAQLQSIAAIHARILDGRIAEKSYRLQPSQQAADEVRHLINAIAPAIPAQQQSQDPLLEARDRYLQQFTRLLEARARVDETQRVMARETDSVRSAFESVEQDLSESLMEQDNDMPAALALAESATALMRKLLALRTAEWRHAQSRAVADYEQWVLLLSDLRSSTQALAGGAQVQQREALDVALAALDRYRAAFDACQASTTTSLQTEREMDRIAEQMLTVSGQLREQVSARQQQLKEQAYAWLLSMALLVLTLGMLTAWLIRRQIIQALRETAEQVERFAEGRLDMQVASRRNDELGLVQRGIARMGENLHRVVSRIEQGAIGLGMAAGELATITEDMARAAAEQVTESERVVSAMQVMDSTLKQVMALTSAACSAAGSARQGSESGRQDIEATVAQISLLDELVREAGQGMRSLDERSLSIGGVLNVIQGLVAQTNLLALNAAIEAARAGEMGRGFSVVADEVRSLANRTQGSAAEISAMIDALQSDSKSALNRVVHAAEESVQAREYSLRANQVLLGVSTDASTIHQMNQQIVSATEAQSLAASEVGRSMQSAREAAAHGQARSQRLRLACTELEELAAQLRQAVSYFRLS